MEISVSYFHEELGSTCKPYTLNCLPLHLVYKDKWLLVSGTKLLKNRMISRVHKRRLYATIAFYLPSAALSLAALEPILKLVLVVARSFSLWVIQLKWVHAPLTRAVAHVFYTATLYIYGNYITQSGAWQNAFNLCLYNIYIMIPHAVLGVICCIFLKNQ